MDTLSPQGRWIGARRSFTKPWRALPILTLAGVGMYSQVALLPSLKPKVPPTAHLYPAKRLRDIAGGNTSDTPFPTLQGPPDESNWLLGAIPVITAKIPRVINKIYFQKDGQFDPDGMPDNLLKAHESWRDQNPGYNVRYFNLADARRYLATNYHPSFLRTFDCIQAFAGKADFFRIALLYRDGGFHSDWKQVCLLPGMLDKISAKTDFFAAIDLGFAYAVVTRSCAQNAFVGSTPRHPIAARYLDLAMRNVQNSSYPENTLLATGPCVLGRAIKMIDPTFGKVENATKFGMYRKNHFYYGNDTIIQHKCCGHGQHWEAGNNYNILFAERRYYCEDSKMIFET